MHVVVIGADKLGLAVAGWLIQAGHEVSVIDSDRERCKAADDAFGVVAVEGDCVSSTVLSEAGADRADAVIATGEDDGVNLAACQLAKHRFDVPRSISVVNRSDHWSIFDSLGVNVVVDAPDLILRRIQEGFIQQGIERLKSLPSNGADQSLVSIKVPRTYGSEGRRLDALPLPAGTLPTLIISGDGTPRLPSPDLVIRAGDEVVAVMTETGQDELSDSLFSDARM